MDALRAREQLRRRYLFPPDAEVSLEREGYPSPGEALPPGTVRAALRFPQARGPETAGPADLPQAHPFPRDWDLFLSGLPSSSAS